jgi:hypothetical protein
MIETSIIFMGGRKKDSHRNGTRESESERYDNAN